MSCKPICGGFKIINTGNDLTLPKVVSRIELNGGKLLVVNTDNSTYELDLPKSIHAPINEINILNATGKRTLAVVLTK